MGSDREHWRRRDEYYWRSKDEACRVYGERTRKIRETDNAARRHRLEAERIDSEISGSEYAAKLTQHLEKMQRLKSDILNQASTCDAARKNWSERLDNVNLTGPGATDQLQELLHEVESNRNLWSKLTWAGASCVTGLTSPLLRPLSSKALSSLDPVELRFQMQEEQREVQRSLNESALGLIASSLSLLITEVRAYHSGSF